MATYSFTSTGTIPASSLAGNNITQAVLVSERNSIVINNAITDLEPYIAYVIAEWENVYGGSITYSISDIYSVPTIGDFYDISFTLTNILTYPTSIEAWANPISFQFKNNDGVFFGFNWFADTTTAITICQTCVPITKLTCEASYNFKAGLTPNTEYTIALENQKGKVYSALITTDSIGGFTIDATATEFPDGMFIPESGIYQLRAYTDSEMTILAPMIFGTTQYDCIELSFLYNQTFTSDIIGVYLLRIDELTTTVIVDDNGSAISLG